MQFETIRVTTKVPNYIAILKIRGNTCLPEWKSTSPGHRLVVYRADCLCGLLCWNVRIPYCISALTCAHCYVFTGSPTKVGYSHLSDQLDTRHWISWGYINQTMCCFMRPGDYKRHDSVWLRSDTTAGVCSTVRTRGGDRCVSVQV